MRKKKWQWICVNRGRDVFAQVGFASDEDPLLNDTPFLAGRSSLPWDLSPSYSIQNKLLHFLKCDGAAILFGLPCIFQSALKIYSFPWLF